MKICCFDDHRVGVVRGDAVYDVTGLLELNARWPLPMGDMVISQLLGRHRELDLKIDTGALPQFQLSQVRLCSPVANPSKIIGAPINYKAHIDEANADTVINHGKTYTSIDHFGLFLKSNSSLIGPSDEVQLRFPDRRNDHEVELAVIIGRGGSNIERERALDHVFGYSIGLDMTVRGSEWPGFRKSPDTYSVLGPWIVTSDEIENPGALDLGIRVNGELRQSSNTRLLIFDVPRLIEYASSFYTLHPGDIIMTGTPEGVSQVHPGDVMDAQIEGIGNMKVAISPQWFGQTATSK